MHMTTREKTLDTTVEALAHTLAEEALFAADIGGYGWDAEKDSSDHFMPTARKKARRYLEGILPAALAKAWQEGFKQGGPMHDEYYGEPDRHKINPYTAEAQVNGL